LFMDYFLFAIHSMFSFNPLPEESAQVLKENIEWIANKK